MGKTTKILIELEIEGDPQDAFNVVDTMLDNGDPQDGINTHEFPDAGPLRVKQASCRVVPECDPDTVGTDPAIKFVRVCLNRRSGADQTDEQRESEEGKVLAICDEVPLATVHVVDCNGALLYTPQDEEG